MSVDKNIYLTNVKLVNKFNNYQFGGKKSTFQNYFSGLYLASSELLLGETFVFYYLVELP